MEAQPRQHQRKTAKPVEPVVIGGEVKWEVAEVLDCRTRGRKKEYFVSWKGFGPKENSWEPKGNMANCAEAMKEFNTKYPDAASRHKRRRRRK
jgi:hypothetical protein